VAPNENCAPAEPASSTSIQRTVQLPGVVVSMRIA
jgi:hypothetical protein